MYNVFVHRTSTFATPNVMSVALEKPEMILMRMTCLMFTLTVILPDLSSSSTGRKLLASTYPLPILDCVSWVVVARGYTCVLVPHFVKCLNWSCPAHYKATWLPLFSSALCWVELLTLFVPQHEVIPSLIYG